MKQSLLASLFVAAFAFIIIAWIPGCAQLLKLQGQATEKAAQGVTAICKNTDQAFRDKAIAELNAKAAPNSVALNCALPPQ